MITQRHKLLLDLADELDRDGNDTTAEAIRYYLRQPVCIVTIKRASDVDFIAEDSETNSVGYGASYPEALVELAKEMCKVGEGCIQILSTFLDEEE